MDPPDPEAPHISLAAGLVIGLLASFIQSLGLTMQRKSHLQNEAVPFEHRKKDFHRPLWIIGFTSFILSNVLGSIFQLGALPIVVLAPLGAISLLWNALFARILLGDVFSRYLIIGTILIACGAILIALFGVVPEPTHSLQDLIHLYVRPRFVICFAIFGFILSCLIISAHFSEWNMHKYLTKGYTTISDYDDTDLESNLFDSNGHANGSNNNYDDNNTNNNNNATEGDNLVLNKVRKGKKLERYNTMEQHDSSNNNQDDINNNNNNNNNNDINSKPLPKSLPKLNIESANRTYKYSNNSLDEPRLPPRYTSIERQCLWIGVAYGIVSGSLSGLCLLFAKTGVELLILTIVGDNQFVNWQSWIILLVLLATALLQLWYLNKSLKLVAPTLICPLAFCFYNIVSIFGGLIYYDQLRLLTGLQYGLVFLGIIILLTGVWIVSIKTETPSEDEEEVAAVLESLSEPVSETDESATRQQADIFGEQERRDLRARLAEFTWKLIQDNEVPRGFSIGLSASSPGFAIKPMYNRASIDHAGSGLNISNDPTHAAKLSRSTIHSAGPTSTTNSGNRSNFFTSPRLETPIHRRAISHGAAIMPEITTMSPTTTSNNNDNIHDNYNYNYQNGDNNNTNNNNTNTTTTTNNRRISDSNDERAQILEHLAPLGRPSFNHLRTTSLTGAPYVGGGSPLHHPYYFTNAHHQHHARRASLPPLQATTNSSNNDFTSRPPFSATSALGSSWPVARTSSNNNSSNINNGSNNDSGGQRDELRTSWFSRVLFGFGRQ